MGGTPTRHHTKSRRNKGRAHFALKPVKTIACPKCHQQVRSHRVCNNCGFYKGREVVNVLAKLDKKERKQREKVLAELEAKQKLANPNSKALSSKEE